MTVRQDHTEAHGQGALFNGARFARFGQLAPAVGAPDVAQIRCSCDRCGAHLLAVARGVDFEGSCPVCMCRRFTPVGHREAA